MENLNLKKKIKINYFLITYLNYFHLFVRIVLKNNYINIKKDFKDKNYLKNKIENTRNMLTPFQIL